MGLGLRIMLRAVASHVPSSIRADVRTVIAVSFATCAVQVKRRGACGRGELPDDRHFCNLFAAHPQHCDVDINVSEWRLMVVSPKARSVLHDLRHISKVILGAHQSDGSNSPTRVDLLFCSGLRECTLSLTRRRFGGIAPCL